VENQDQAIVARLLRAVRARMSAARYKRFVRWMDHHGDDVVDALGAAIAVAVYEAGDGPETGIQEFDERE